MFVCIVTMLYFYNLKNPGHWATRTEVCGTLGQSCFTVHKFWTHGIRTAYLRTTRQIGTDGLRACSGTHRVVGCASDLFGPVLEQCAITECN
jgi:hypothetical protein